MTHNLFQNIYKHPLIVMQVQNLFKKNIIQNICRIFVSQK